MQCLAAVATALALSRGFARQVGRGMACLLRWGQLCWPRLLSVIVLGARVCVLGVVHWVSLGAKNRAAAPGAAVDPLGGLQRGWVAPCVWCLFLPTQGRRKVTGAPSQQGQRERQGLAAVWAPGRKLLEPALQGAAG